MELEGAGLISPQLLQLAEAGMSMSFNLIINFHRTLLVSIHYRIDIADSYFRTSARGFKNNSCAGHYYFCVCESLVWLCLAMPGYAHFSV